MKNTKIGFIGGGNMARSLIGGLISSGTTPDSLYVCDIDQTTLSGLSADFAVNTSMDSQLLVKNCAVIVLAVKPQIMKQVIKQLVIPAETSLMFITVAAGIRIESIQHWLETGPHAIVRAMPNTPALVQTGASALFANPHTSTSQKELAESILRAVGLVAWVENESLMDSVTALSGSGPAYFFLLMEAMEEAAIKMGLDQKTARLLAIQTGFGAAKLALEIEEAPAILRERVTSPGGTTEQALQVMQQAKIKNTIEEAMQAACKRACQLADELGK